MVGRAKAGFRKDGRMTALDLFIVEDNGPYGPMGDHRSAGSAASLIWQPLAMRWRGVAVLTNTPPRSQQRSPGAMQGNGLMEGVVTKAANKLGLDQLAIRRVNSPEGKAKYGPPAAKGERRYVTLASVKEALDRGGALFNWTERAARAGKRTGSKIRGVGVAVGPHGAGSIGYDGLMTIRPDGKLYVQSGIGNLGTHSVIDVARVAADTLALPWEKVEVIWGNTGQHVPWTCMSVGSQTTHAMTRANLAAAEDARRKLQEIAARDPQFPGRLRLGGERVFARNIRARHQLPRAAKRALELGGRFDGHELPTTFTRSQSLGDSLAGLGLMGVADNYRATGTPIRSSRVCRGRGGRGNRSRRAPGLSGRR
jgi:CO/xanthine dehydrogenase Mo-binding subunit